MRIIAGTLRGRPLRAPRGHLTRPSTDRVREAIFSLVAHRQTLAGASVLDLFAGTGALGLEALSRGASLAIFVEHQAVVLASARTNAARLGVTERCLFVRQDAIRYLERRHGMKHDVIFADPPYALPRMAELPDLAAPHLAKRGLLVLEHDKRISFADHVWLQLCRPYGRTIVSVLSPVP